MAAKAWRAQRLMKLQVLTGVAAGFVDENEEIEVLIAQGPYEDLGKPTVVTVTFETGDRLNEPEKP